MESNLIDNITGIHNEEYLKRNYQSYINDNPNSNFIMIDFEKFKSINDTFGHNVGDNYLRVFAKILNNNFKDSIVVRLHGDEFAILTKYSEEDIDKIFQLCNKKISLAVLEGIIPKIFHYNAGSAKAEHGINNTKEKADFMMYYAKKNSLYFQKFSQSILQEKLFQDSFLDKIDVALKHDGFSYTIRQLFNKANDGQSIFQIYTKDKDGYSIFDNSRYDILRKTSKLQQFDVYNIQNLLENVIFHECQMFITIDYKSLILADNFLDYLIILKDISSLPFKNIVLSIDIRGIEVSCYQKVIEKINMLKELGFKICFDKFDSMIGDSIWEESNIDYIKISDNYWKKAISNSKICFAIESKIKTYDKCKIVPIFGFVEKKEEYDFLTEFIPENTLLSGNYFSKEKKLLLKK